MLFRMPVLKMLSGGWLCREEAEQFYPFFLRYIGHMSKRCRNLGHFGIRVTTHCGACTAYGRGKQCAV